MDSTGLTLCIVNFNGKSYLEKTLASVCGDRDAWKQILLVDNGSSDGSLDLVRERFPSVQVIPLERNYGAGVARNAAFAAAKTQRVLFIDNDVVPAPGCAAALGRALDEAPAAVFAMPCILYDADPGTVQYDGAAAHCTGLMILEHARLPVDRLPLVPRRIGSLVTACFLVDRLRWGREALFDDLFFYNLEDHELGLRARLLGHEILSVPVARAYHGEGTVGVSLRQVGYHTAMRVHHTILNRWKVILKLYRLRTLLLLAPSLLLFEGFQLAGAFEKGWLGAWGRAVAWMIRHAPELLSRRRAFQRERRLPDGAVLTGGSIPFTRELRQRGLERIGAALLDRSVDLNWKLVRRWL